MKSEILISITQGGGGVVNEIRTTEIVSPAVPVDNFC